MNSFKLYLNFFAMLLMVSTFVACGDDDTPEPMPETITEIAAATDNLSTLVSALTRTGLDATLNGTGNFTVFAPTDAAFTAAGIDLSTLTDDELKNILLYHVLGAEVKAGDIADGQTYAASLSTSGPGMTALSLLIEKGTDGVKINNAATVFTPDVDATNGVIHIVDAVLLPLDIVGHASANSNFTALVGALGTATGDLVTVLQGDGPFTVFAPLNSAFEAISDVTATLTPEQLSGVLTYHVVSGNATAGVLESGDYPTVNGATFAVTLGSPVTITDGSGAVAEVKITDVQGTNGVIHVLDKVLLP